MKTFITHGGYHSLQVYYFNPKFVFVFQEAIGAGIPLVMIGLFSDQFKNTRLAEKHGFARVLSKSNFTADSIYEALTAVIQDEKFSKAVKRLSAMVNKQPIPAEMLLVRWTEFVAEFKTLENLEPASMKLNFAQVR